MNKPPLGFTLVEWLVHLAIAALFVSLLNWTFRGFSVLTFLAATAVILAIVAGIVHGWKVLAALSIPAVVFVIPIVVMLPTVFPTQFARLHGGQFENAELVSVLSRIAGEKVEPPIWRFRLPDRELANTRVSVAIPTGCRLGTALELVADAADCEYDWHWFSFCGNAPPGRAEFCFRRRGATADWLTNASVNVDRDRVWQFQDNGWFEYRDGAWQPGK